MLSDSPILYPYVTKPDILVVMSQEAYVRIAPELKDGGILIVEQDMVRVSDVNKEVQVYSIPATRIAEELGKRMVLNAVMVGFFTAVTNLLDAEAVRKAVADSVPKSFLDLNLKAFEKGLEYGAIALTAPADTADAELQGIAVRSRLRPCIYADLVNVYQRLPPGPKPRLDSIQPRPRSSMCSSMSAGSA